MGSNFKSFFRNVGHSIKRFGGHVNRGFNVIKHHAKRAIPYIKNVAGLVRDAAQEWSSLPVVGAYASQIGAVARGIHQGASTVEKVLNASDRWQNTLGIDRSMR